MDRESSFYQSRRRRGQTTIAAGIKRQIMKVRRAEERWVERRMDREES
jgi:hypothetical protein